MSDDSAMPAVSRLNVHDADWRPFPEFGGTQALLHTSEDGSRMAATFKLTGRHSWTLEYDDFFYVVAGHASIEGTAVTFEMSEDFHEISVLVSDAPFDHTDHAGT